MVRTYHSHKTVILRPGALGDVIAVRGLIRFLKDANPAAQVCLIAPGERGRLFQREGWADAWFDWESGDIAWLFSGGEFPAPKRLQEFFAGCDRIVSFVGDAANIERNLSILAPGATVTNRPARPEPGCGVPVGQWLLHTVFENAGTAGVSYPAGGSDPTRARMICAPSDQGTNSSVDRSRYAVLHPGSGSVQKNWPVEKYIELGRLLLKLHRGQGEPEFSRLVITSGEADGDLGFRMAEALPGALHLHAPPLEHLAGVLAGAQLYVGNDSGVSHLAGAVKTADGSWPDMIIFFGPSDPAIWAPPGAVTVRLGDRIQDIEPKWIESFYPA